MIRAADENKKNNFNKDNIIYDILAPDDTPAAPSLVTKSRSEIKNRKHFVYENRSQTHLDFKTASPQLNRALPTLMPTTSL